MAYNNFCVIGCLLLVSGIGVSSYMMQSAHDAVHKQMEYRAQEYKNRIFKQFDKDIQALNTLASLLSMERLPFSDADRMMIWMAEANCAYNDFVSLAYFTPDGKGMINTYGTESDPDFPLSSCSEDIQTVVNKSFVGEDGISNLFVSDVTEERIYVYSVPVWNDGEVIGALAASSRLDIFKEIANGDTVMDGNGFVHLIGSEGKFLVQSTKSIVPMIQEYTTIFDGPYIAQEDRMDILAVMENQERGFFEFRYEKGLYHFYLQPLEINGWYLMCADTQWGEQFLIRKVILFAGGCFFLVSLLAYGLLISGYFMMRKNYKRLIKLAFFDRVTGAENFARFELRLAECLQHTEDYSIVAANIHNFKYINELFGRDAGDLLLNYLNKQFEACIQEGEYFCRDAADQFYLLLLDTDEKRIKARLYDVVSHVSERARGKWQGFDISVYCGVAVRGETYQALLAQQYIRKSANKFVHFYDTEIHKIELRNNYIESHMEQALENGEFKLYLQPKVRLSDETVVGAEALVRWQTDDRKFFSPGDFIPLFEANGFCIRLDLYMVECVCRQLREWIDNGITPIPVSVNQSRLLFMEQHYVDNLKKILDKYQIPASLIVLEILEGLAAENLAALDSRIDQLQSAGFKVSMDDFGSGYSSLNTLYRLRLDELKIDRAFLFAAPPEHEKMRLVILEQIMNLAKKLNIRTVCEGIETEENADLMKSFGCDYGQGYFYSKPLSAKEFNRDYMCGSL